METLKKENPLAWHKKNIEAFGDYSKELQAYVQQHFDRQRELLNHKGEKRDCGSLFGCHDNQHVLS